MKKKTVIFSDTSNDDFSSVKVRRRIVYEDFPFIHDSLAWRIIATLLYYGIAVPIAFIINKVWFGVRIENRRSVRKINRGVFMYGNHTQYFSDATCPAMIAFPHRAYVIAGAEAVSIKGIGWLVQMLGGLILPTERNGTPKFREAVSKRITEGARIAIYPEAHIWPYYTGIRDFSPASFLYPVSCNTPVVAYVTTYRKRILSFLPPAITIIVSEPFYPDSSLDERTSRKVLRDQVFEFMCEQTQRNEDEYIQYVRK